MLQLFSLAQHRFGQSLDFLINIQKGKGYFLTTGARKV